MRKQWNYVKTDAQVVAALQKALGIAPLLCELLVQRGITTYETAKQFFRPQLQHLHDPFLMKNMPQAVHRLQQAIEKGERILLYGDYDVDGVTSVAMMLSFLKPQHTNIDYYIPDRYQEGYGISLTGIEYAKTTQTKLLIAMDCGIKAHQALALAKSYQIDCIVCDHHLPDSQLPEAFAILNPKQIDCPYPYKELTGCGVAFKLAQAYQTSLAPNWARLEDLLDFVVVSTACDIVPIKGENRVLSYFGLKKIHDNPRPGFQVLLEQSNNLPPYSIRDLVFGIGPKLNAAGRIAHAREAVELLLAVDQATVIEKAQLLQERNTLRKNHEQNITMEAGKQFEAESNWQQKKSLVVYDPNWHKGVVGIVAARMVEQFYRPSIVFTKAGGRIVGSARSIRHFNIYEAIKACEGLLVNYGGHQYAAGLTLLPENLAAFRQKFETTVAQQLHNQALIPEIDIAARLQLQDITPTFWKILKQFAPFGPQNHNPIFVSKQVRRTNKTKVLKDKHLRLGIHQEHAPEFIGIGFGLGHFYNDIEHTPFDLCYTIQENTWRGKTNLQLNVKDIEVNEHPS